MCPSLDKSTSRFVYSGIQSLGGKLSIMDKVRFIVVDDQLVARQGLCRLLEADESLECVGIADSGSEAIKLVEEQITIYYHLPLPQGDKERVTVLPMVTLKWS